MTNVGTIVSSATHKNSALEMDFAGFTIGPTTVSPCTSLMDAIKNFPTPKNVTDIRSLFGLINQVSFAFASADKMKPFRNFLKPNIKFSWTDVMQNIFEEAKAHIISEIQHGVEIFDKYNMPGNRLV